MPERSTLRIISNPKMKTMKRLTTLIKKSVGHQKKDRNHLARAMKFLPVAFVFCFVICSSSVSAQLGIYEFTGTGSCPNQNSNVTTQPANATFGSISTVNTTCLASTDIYATYNWNTGSSIDVNEYDQFSITSAPGYGINLTSLTFNHRVSKNGSGG